MLSRIITFSLIFFSLIIGFTSAQNGGNQVIKSAEYFFDIDPGEGNGILISDTFNLRDITVYLEGLTLPSGKTIYIRFLTSDSIWSAPASYKRKNYYSNSGATLQYAEYFINEDPGEGNGISIPIEEGEIEIPNLQLNNNDVIYIRVRDNYNRWSNPSSYKNIDYFKNKGGKIVYAEYFGKDDPGRGNGINIPVADSTIVSIEIDDIDVLPDSILKIRVKDDLNRWSHPYLINLKDSLIKQPEAKFEAIKFSEINSYKFNFINRSRNSNIFYWDFGDNTKSYQDNPEHVYTKTGAYTVRLIAENKVTKDTLYQTITVNGVDKIEKNYGGNTGFVSINVYGGGFKAGTTFILRKSGVSDIKGDSIRYPKPGVMSVFLNLKNKPAGVYDVIIKVPGETLSWTIKNGFTIKPGTSPQPWVDISGQSSLQPGIWQTHSLSYGNKGNTDGLGVPLWLAVSDIPGVEIMFTDFSITNSEYLSYRGIDSIIDTIPIYINSSKVFNDSGNFRIYPLYIPRISAGETKTINISIRTNAILKDKIKLLSWITQPLYSADFEKSTGLCYKSVMTDLYASELIPEIPASECINSKIKSVFNPYHKIRKSNVELGSLIHNIAGTYLLCSTDTSGIEIVATSVVSKLLSLIYNGKDLNTNYCNCEKQANPISKCSIAIETTISDIIEEKAGPNKIIFKQYSNKNKSLPYMIFTENRTSYTTKAYRLIVIDTLDKTKFDFNTFSFGKITFGSNIIKPLEGLQKFTKNIDMRPSEYITVRIIAVLDTAKGIAKWEFQTLDTTTTSYILNHERGFLPSNFNRPEGEVSVSYSCELLNTAVLNDTINNKSEMVYNTRDALATNKYSFTIDDNKPESKINDLPYELHDTTVSLRWQGTDNGSGIFGYNIYMVINDTLKVQILYNTPDTSVTITHLKLGYNYKFFSIAVDSVLNIEEKSGFDTQVLVLCKDLPNANIYPQGSTDICEGTSAELHANTGEGLAYKWLSNGNIIQGATLPNYSATTAGDYQVIVYSGTYCYNTSSAVTITINPLPVLNIYPLVSDTTIYYDQSILLDAGTGFSSYEWNTGSTSQTITVNGWEIGTGNHIFKVTVTNTYECSSSDSIMVIIVERPVFSIRGKVTYLNHISTPLNNTTLELKNSEGTVISTTRTDINGNYNFNNIISGNYTITAYTSKQWNGGNPLDALLVNKYFIQIYFFTDSLFLKCSDVNNDKAVNTLDALQINRRYVYLISSFAAGDWLFDKPEINVLDNDVNVNIKGVCYGDANGSYIPPLK